MEDRARISVLAVDDNPHVAEAVRLKLASAGSFEWRGWLSRADSVVEVVRRENPAIVILDVDMPGCSPFEVVFELRRECPDTRVVVFSGHVRLDLIDRALEAGAWGYASKNDGEEELITLLRQVASGHVAFSQEARATLDGR